MPGLGGGGHLRRQLRGGGAAGRGLSGTGRGAAGDPARARGLPEHFAPDELFRRLRPYADPFAFIAADPAFGTLRAGYAEDMARARALKPELADDRHALHILPAEPWARRASGILANRLAGTSAERAHALLTRLPTGGFMVSVRAPTATGTGADALCRRFPTGGGRRAAAGIDYLPDDGYDEFVRQFTAAF